MAVMTGGEALAHSLVREGIELVFGLPGVQVMDAIDALHGLGDMRLVTVRNEQAATYMAFGYARTTGKIGVALVVPGPGALNAASGLLTAYSVSTPVLLISGQVERQHLGKEHGALHEVTEQLDVFRPITKWCHRVLKPEEVPSALHRAFEAMRTGRPRPTEVEVPWDVLSARADVELAEREPPRVEVPDQDKVREAAKLLARAKRPLIWAGGGTMTAGAWQEVQELAEALGAAVITTHEAKGVMPEDHPLSLGSDYSGHGPAFYAVPQADVVLAVGSRLFFPRKLPWAFRRCQDLVQIDIDPAEVGRNWPVSVGIVADAKVALKAVLSELGGKKAMGWSPTDVAEIRELVRASCRRHAPLQVEMVQALRRELDEDAIVVAGITNVAYWANLTFPALKPRTWVTTSYAASLGYELPAAIGASVGNPGRHVVALCGDGGFMYGVSELATAVQEGANVVAIVFNDGAFGASLYEQMTRLHGRILGTRLRNPDFAALARAFGAQGIRADTPHALGGALEAASKHGGVTVIEVPMPTLPSPFQLAPTGSEE